MINLIGIKTEEGYYITDSKVKSTYGYSGVLTSHLVNGVILEKSFHNDWFISKEEPKTLQKKVSGKYINSRYELKDKSLADRFKEVYLRDEVFKGYDDDDDAIYTEEFKSIMSLYEFKQDKEEDYLEDVEFTYTTIQELKKIEGSTPFSYARYGDYNKPTKAITNSNVKYDIIDEIVTPSVLIHTKPVKLSHQESFDIIRAYIKDNINPKVAEITSDYNFCLTVKKKIIKPKPVAYTVDVNNSLFSSRKKKPKFETRYQTHTSVTVFEVAPKAYQNYTVVTPFEAESENDLKEYIDAYLEELITVINTPLTECECCKGAGVIIK